MTLCRIVEFPAGSKAGSEEAREAIHLWVEATHDAAWRGRKRIDPKLTAAVAKIVEDVRRRGWKAALKYTRRFDCPTLRSAQLEVSKREIASARIPEAHHDAILHSIERVRTFHEAQLKKITAGWRRVRLHGGIEPLIGWEWRIPASDRPDAGFEGQRLLPIRSVGVYVPGGNANYPSSVIMNAVPAEVAGSPEIMVCTPPRADGSVSPAVLVAARELGIERIVKCGGAQAIALMAFGPWGEPQITGPFDSMWGPVDKIVGPGNRWVNEAKRQLWGQVGLDTFAGPSEVCIFADETANPAFAAADWLTQIEHAEDNVGYLVTPTREVADAILAEAEKQLSGAPREATMRKALAENGLVVVGPPAPYCGPTHANQLAAEHTSLLTADPMFALDRLENSGCVLLGPYTPQSAGDFVSGPSHTLPTGGAARFSSPVNVMDFLKFQSIGALTKDDLRDLLPTIEAFGEMEDFPQHARGAMIRFESE